MTLSALDFFAISVFSLLLLVIIASTVFDVATRNKNYEQHKILTSFSLFTNGRNLVHLEPKSSRSIECFHGLRALSAFWVIAGHRVFRHDRMVSRPMKIEGFLSQAVIAVIMTLEYAVDTFFLISGVLIAQSCLRSLNAKNLNLIKIYFTRYMRYMPTLALLLLFFTSSFQFLLVDGPAIGLLSSHVNVCQRYWWSSLLLIQTYVNVETICMPVTWYLNADFHLFLLSPLFIYLLWKFGNRILWLFVAAIVVSQTTIFFLRYYNTVSEEVIYRQSHYRIAQFLVGIALGYIMYERDGKHHMRKRSQMLGWLITLGIFLAIEVIHETNKSSKLALAFYASVHRISWACMISWLIYCCHHLKSARFINWVLSQPLWQPISRMSLSIYLIHDIYIVLSVADQKERWYFEPSWLLHIIAGDIMISTFLGAVLYLMVEGPSNLVLKYLLK